MERRPVRLPTIVAVALFAAILGACGSDGPAANLISGTTVAGDAAPTPTDAPAATEAPAEPDTPAPTEPAPDEPTTPDPTTPAQPDPGDGAATPDDSSDNSWVIPLLIIGGLILAAVVVGAVVSRSKKSPAPQHNPATPSPQSSLLSTSQWITDQLALELMAAPPTAAAQRWSVERSRLDNVVIGAQQQYLEVQDANWQPLAQTMSALATAIDTNLQLRAQDPPNAQLINESTAVVNRHRTDIQQLVAALRLTIDR